MEAASGPAEQGVATEVVTLSKDEVERMRAQGHNIPIVRRVPKRSTLSIADRIHCVTRLFEIRDEVWFALVRKQGMQGASMLALKQALRGGSFRFPWAATDKRRETYAKYIAPDQRMVDFLNQTWHTSDGAEEEGDFANLFDRWCNPTMNQRILNLTVNVLILEQAGAARGDVQLYIRRYMRECDSSGVLLDTKHRDMALQQWERRMAEACSPLKLTQELR